MKTKGTLEVWSEGVNSMMIMIMDYRSFDETEDTAAQLVQLLSSNY